MLALPLGDSEEPKIFSTICLRRRIVEPAGQPFEDLLTLWSKKDSYEDLLDMENVDINNIKDEKEEYWWENEYRKQQLKETKKAQKSNKGRNFYEVLNLSEKFIRSEEDDMRKAYKRIVIRAHPDKITVPDDAIFFPFWL